MSPTLPTSPRRAGLLSRRVLTSCALASMLALGACQANIDPALASPEYPAEKAQTATLDIQVVRDGTVIRLTNTTARSFGKSRLWINRWYSREVPEFAIGQTLELSLKDFRDQYGEEFRAGGFFATRQPDRLVEAQLETANTMLGLVVVQRNEE